MKLRALLAPIAALLCVLPRPAAAVPEEEAAAARALLPKISPAVVELKVAVSFPLTYGGRTTPRELRIERLATVISPSGLAVTPFSGINPAGATEAVLARYPQLRGKIQIGEAGFKEVKFQLQDGTEIPARVVLKDPDLDVAFIAPLPDPAAKRTFAYVRLDPSVKPEVLGDYFLISRSGEATGRIPTLFAASISAITAKPHRIYLTTMAFTGVPMFDADGSVLGVLVAQVFDGHPVQGAAAVLPAAAILSEVPQAEAAAAKPPPAPPPADEDDTGGDSLDSGGDMPGAPAHPPPAKAPSSRAPSAASAATGPS